MPLSFTSINKQGVEEAGASLTDSKEDNLTDYIKDKYKDIDLKVRNENGNVFLNKDVIYVILKELEENNQVVYENEKFNLK